MLEAMVPTFQARRQRVSVVGLFASTLVSEASDVGLVKELKPEVGCLWLNDESWSVKVWMHFDLLNVAWHSVDKRHAAGKSHRFNPYVRDECRPTYRKYWEALLNSVVVHQQNLPKNPRPFHTTTLTFSASCTTDVPLIISIAL
jgi:hypothetical protein